MRWRPGLQCVEGDIFARARGIVDAALRAAVDVGRGPPPAYRRFPLRICPTGASAAVPIQ